MWRRQLFRALLIPALMQILLLIATSTIVSAHSDVGVPPPPRNTTCSSDYAKNAQYIGQTFVSLPGTEFTFTGPYTATISRSVTVSSNWGVSVSAGTSIKAVDVSAEVKHDVGESQTVQIQYSLPVPQGKVYRVFADQVNDSYAFEVWHHPCTGSDTQIGTGWTDLYNSIHYGWYDETPSDSGSGDVGH